MFCRKCGMENDDNVRFCVYCGEPNPQVTSQQQYHQYEPIRNQTNNQQHNGGFQSHQLHTNYEQAQSGNMSKDQFAKLPAMTKYNKEIMTCGYICYICAVVTIVAMTIINGNFLGIADAGVLVICGLLIQLKKSYITSIILLGYGVLGLIAMLAVYGSAGGYLIIIAGVFGIINTRKLDKAYKQYKKTGILPQSENK